jgi:hypothetical protein
MSNGTADLVASKVVCRLDEAFTRRHISTGSQILSRETRARKILICVVFDFPPVFSLLITVAAAKLKIIGNLYSCQPVSQGRMHSNSGLRAEKGGNRRKIIFLTPLQNM